MVVPTLTRARQSRFLKQWGGYFKITKICIRSHWFEMYFPAQNPRAKERNRFTTRGLNGREVEMATLKSIHTLQAGDWVCDTYKLVSPPLPGARFITSSSFMFQNASLLS